MKRSLSAPRLCAALVSAMAGYAVSPGGSVVAQPPAAPEASTRPGPSFQSVIPASPLSQPVPMWPNQPTEAAYWSIDDIRKAHEILTAADESGRKVDPNSTLHDFPYWTRTHSLFVAHRSGKPGPAEAEQHAGYSQFIVIMGGTGTVVAGGVLQDKVTLSEGNRQVPGEWRGTSISGGETFKMQAGEWLSIPPDTPAHFRADAGGLTYMVMKINAMLYPWDLIR